MVIWGAFYFESLLFHPSFAKYIRNYIYGRENGNLYTEPPLWQTTIRRIWNDFDTKLFPVLFTHNCTLSM